MNSVHDYILSNWKSTIHSPKENIPYPYTTPCADDLFVNFFYWDTYFTNLGLLRDGYEEQALNNLKVMVHFVKTLGYIPNADHLLYRSQPPLFIRGVYDYVNWMRDDSLIPYFKDAMIAEMAFFDSHRKVEFGLYAYSSEEPKAGLDWYYDEFSRRLGGYNEAERAREKYGFGRALLGIAESGWDFNVRFHDGKVRFASDKFAHLDLSCLIYDAKKKLAEMLKGIGDEEYLRFEKEAKDLKESILGHLYDASRGVFLDYDYVDKKFSPTLSAASFYPYALGISNDKEGAKKVFEALDLPYGLSTAEYRGKEAYYYQWDYPAMWPSNVYFGYEALVNVGANEEAALLKKQYMGTVERVYAATGKLWEKYDALKGEVSITSEYKTPTMMGWTSGVYEYLNSK